MEYKASDFYEVGLIKSDVIKHVIDSVRDFSKRYDVATDYALYYRCSLRAADPILYEEICDSVFDCIETKNIDASSFEDEVYEDIEIVFN